MESIWTIESLIRREKISMELRRVASNPILSEESHSEGIEHFRCELSRPGRHMHAFISIDSLDGSLNISDVMFLLALDASGCMMLEGFEEFKDEWFELFGDSEENRKEIAAFRQEYRRRLDQVEAFRDFLGYQAYEKLLDHFGLDSWSYPMAEAV